MKIAVLLFGHLRDFEKCAGSLKENLLERYDCDLFMHTWDETEPSTVSWHKDRTEKRKVDDQLISVIKHLYPLKGLLIEHQEKYKEEKLIVSEYRKDKTVSNAGMHYMFDTMFKANELRLSYEKDNNISYDMIVVTRPDVKLKRPLIIEEVLNQAVILGLDLYKCRFYASLPISSSYGASLYINEPNDLLFFAKPAVIDQYIMANKNISEDFISKHFINIVSVYTSMEIESGINPVPISYSMGIDWSFSRTRVVNKGLPHFKGIIAKFLVWFFRPVFYLNRKYEWLNYYN